MLVDPIGENDPLPFKTTQTTVVDEKPKFEGSRFEAIDELSPMRIIKFFDCFHFTHDLGVSDEVRLIRLLQRLALVVQRETWMMDEGNSTFLELALQTFVINCLHKPNAHFLVDFKTSAHHLIGFLLV